MTAERKPNFIEKGVARGVEVLAPLSKTLDKIFIGGGIAAVGVGAAVKSAAIFNAGALLIVFNLATLAFANETQKWARKKLGK